jgi:glutamine synthetase adenylyltransferase
MDVEFLVALGQLTGALADPALRTTETTVALGQLVVRQGWPGELIGDYERLRALAMRMRLLHERPEDVIAPEELPALARSLELEPDALRADLDRSMRRIRAVFLERFPA